MKHRFIQIMLLIFSLSPISVFAMEWARTYGVNDDHASSIQQTADGGYIVAGRTGFEDPSTGEDYYDIWVLKLDSNGSVSWQKTYDMNNYDHATSIQQTADGGYIVAGQTGFYDYSTDEYHYDIWILKLDSNGDITWQKTYDVNNYDYARSIQQTADGGYIVAGYAAKYEHFTSHQAALSDMWILKLDSSGNISWQKTYGGSDDDYATSIRQTADGGYIVAGYTGKVTPGNYPFDMWILKLDSSGNISWQKTYGGSYYDVATSIQQTADGGYIVAGFTDFYGDLSYIISVLKLDSSGNVSWQKTYRDSQEYLWEFGYSIQQTADGDYVVAGCAMRLETMTDKILLLKLDSNGNLLWKKTYGGSEDENCDASSIQQTADGGYIVAGTTYDDYSDDRDVLILKLDSSGEIPGCEIPHTSDAIIDILSFSVEDTNVTPQTSNAVINAPGVSPQNSSAKLSTLCAIPSCILRDKDNHSLEVIGAAADGLSQVVIQINDLPADVTIADIQITLPEEDGHLENDKTLNNGIFTQTYTAQTYFVRSGHSEDLSQGKREINLTIKVNGQEIPHDPFYLFKPPLVLIHGLWSNSGTWNVLINHLGSIYGNLIYAIDYRDSNSSHFEENVNRIGNFITDMINTAKTNYTKLGVTKPIVIKKADVVAHSMGGILASLYIASDTYRSDVNRLISIGTPFSGSQLANYVLYFLFGVMPEEERAGWLDILNAAGLPVLNGAVEDLQVDSQAINQFINNLHSYNIPVPVYAITCDGDSGTPDSKLNIAYWVLGYWDLAYAWKAYFGMGNVESTMFCTNDSDFVCAFESQKGGSSKYTKKYVVDHMNETSDYDVITEVRSLLNLHPDQFNTESFFKPTVLTCLKVPAITIPPEYGSIKIEEIYAKKYKEESSFITIASPQNGSSYQPGDNIHIQAICQSPVESVLFVTPFGWYEDDAAPYEYDVTIDNEFAGQFTIVAAALSSNGLIDYDSIQLSSAPSESPTSLKVGPSDSIVLEVGKELSLYVYGVYQDGSIRDITTLSSTNYTSSNAAIVEVSSAGLLTVKSQGEAIITVENSGVKEDITVMGKAPSTCTTWNEVISKYNSYVSGQASWTDVITCYNQYVSQ